MRLSSGLLGAALVVALVWPGPRVEAEAPADDPPAPSKFKDPQDGWFDISGFLDESYGFAPIVVPITEPAVGYGAAGALVFIDKQKAGAGSGAMRQNITAVGGLATENDTWGLFGLDSRYWMDGRIQTNVALIKADVHLDYYGLGADGGGQGDPVPYQLIPLGGRVQTKYRLGASRTKVGLALTLATMRVVSDPGGADTLFPAVERDTRLSGLTPSITYDSRNTIFTPTRGIYADAQVSAYSEALGSDSDHQRVDLVFIGYYPVTPRVTVGSRGIAGFSFNDAPFYMHPFVMMRGIAAMRYQGEEVVQIEAEVRWQLWKRFSLVGFGGVGTAQDEIAGEELKETVDAFGTGFRYEIARKYGLHMGLDVAWGPDETAIYVQFGNAWIRL